MDDATQIKPVIPYLGSKRNHLKLIANNLPPAWNSNGNTYLEPFLGSGIVFQYLKPKNAVVSDMSPFLMCMWECLRENSEVFLNIF